MQTYMMKKLASLHPDKEVCGFTVTVDGIETILPVPNVHYHPKNNFAMHVQLQNIYMEGMLEQITGMYHSHNNGSHMPSKSDLAAWPKFPEAADWSYYIIVDGAEVWSWKLVDGEPVGVRID